MLPEGLNQGINKGGTGGTRSFQNWKDQEPIDRPQSHFLGRHPIWSKIAWVTALEFLEVFPETFDISVFTGSNECLNKGERRGESRRFPNLFDVPTVNGIGIC